MFPLVISSLLGFFFIAKNCFLIGCHFIPTNSSWFITDVHLPQPARCPPAVVLPGWKKFKLIALGQILHITPMTDVMLQVVRQTNKYFYFKCTMYIINFNKKSWLGCLKDILCIREMFHLIITYTKQAQLQSHNTKQANTIQNRHNYNYTLMAMQVLLGIPSRSHSMLFSLLFLKKCKAK